MQDRLFEISSSEHTQRAWFREIKDALGIVDGPAWPDEFGSALRQWLSGANHRPIKTLSLFSGGGGLDIAFHDAGFQISQMVELEPRYAQTLRANSGADGLLEGSDVLCCDIRDYEPDADLDVDFIIGGPPCQTFSAAGRRAAGVAGTGDARGTLFEEYVRVLDALQPTGFLFENVYGITGAKSGEDWRRIQSAFEAAGYTIHSRILDAADYGVPQHRERLFIVGLRDGAYLFPYPTHGPDSVGGYPFYSAVEAVEGIDVADVERGIGGRFGALLADIPPGLNYSFYTKEMGHPSPVFSWRSKFSDFLYKADPNVPTRTIKAQGGQYTGPFSWENRKFSLGELKRLQTFPDSYEIVGGQQVSVEQIGNSVPPQIGRVLALSILNQVMGVELPFTMHYLPPEKVLGFRKRKRLLTKLYVAKAKTAIDHLYSSKHASLPMKPRLSKQRYTRFLSESFLWQEAEIFAGVKLKLSFELDSYYLSLSAGLSEDEETKYVINVKPSVKDGWCLEDRKVRLIATALDPRVFTGLWKAFEEKLYETCGVADLVQLSGYYQYAPRMSASMSFTSSLKVDPTWHVVSCIVQGIGVADQLPAHHLASLWGIDATEVLPHLRTLRRMGYEVRSHNTNPQIADGDYLIPYAFPTLTPRSVQLRKRLEVEADV